MRHDLLVEKAARALCWANGMDPNISLNGDGRNFLWAEYEHQAEAVIEAMGFFELLNACEESLIQNGNEYPPLKEKLKIAINKAWSE